MTPKFRIYDKGTSSYIPKSSSRFLISSSGRLYDAIKFEWHEIGLRYVVEMMVAQNSRGEIIYEDDIVVASYGYGFPNPEVVVIGDFNSAISECLIDDDLKIIGTIHDEKYKNL